MLTLEETARFGKQQIDTHGHVQEDKKDGKRTVKYQSGEMAEAREKLLEPVAFGSDGSEAGGEPADMEHAQANQADKRPMEKLKTSRKCDAEGTLGASLKVDNTWL